MATMDKKKKKKLASAAVMPVATPPSTEFKSSIQEHSAFFDKLIELIPAKFYLPQNDDSSDHPKAYFHGLSKAAKASLKLQSKQNLKLSRRNRHDPEKINQCSTLDQLRQSLQPSAADVGDNNEDKKEEDEKSVTYEELRQKLRRKIELLRGNRGEKPKENKENRVDRKRKREDGGTKEEVVSGGKSVNAESSEGEPVIEYGKVRISGDNEGERKRKKKKKKMSKEKELERAKRLEEVKRENPKAAERERWKSATMRAMGEKVHDDPKLLKQSMKKEKKRREKNAEKWKERKEDQEKAKEARQQKRKENIAGKIKEARMRKIAKREKKLMRPGFEGRKEEYITKD